MRLLSTAIAVALALAMAGLTATRSAAAEAQHGVKVGPFMFSKLAEQLPAGEVYATFQKFIRFKCKTTDTLRGDGLLKMYSLNTFGPIFAREMGVVSGISRSNSVNLFNEDDPDGYPPFEIGSLIHSMDLSFCEDFDPNDRAKGHGSMSIQWQIYSRSKNSLMVTIETNGEFTQKGPVSRSRILGLVAEGVFAENVKQLIVSPQFKALLEMPPPKDELASVPGKQERISAPAASTRVLTADDASGSVVLVEIPEGHGSGVLVSADGYILTNAHVVGPNKTVSIRWSDGFQTQGQVVRVHRKRDVALIKTDPHGRQPLSARKTPAQPGDTVLAIGAPLDRELQGTITRGVVSANRIIDGFSFIQSDVGVNHGNSGGPLLDDKGHVIGLTDIGLQPNGSPIGLNFFIPIKDALDFLSLDLVQPPVEAPPVQKASAPRTGVKKAVR